MKIKIMRSKLLDALKGVQNIIPGKGTLPVIQNTLIEADNGKLKMTTTDLEVSINYTGECEVVESGLTTLPAKLLFNSVAKLAEGEVIIEVDSKDRASVTAGNANFKIAGMAAKEFPALPKSEEEVVYKLPQATFKEMLRKVAYAASQDDTRRTLKGVLMRFKDAKLTMVATDGRRLALVEQEVEFPPTCEKDIVIPYKTVVELQRSLMGEEDIEIKVHKSQISFTFGSLTIYSKMVEDKYPPYEQVIPTTQGEKIAIDRQLLIDALERANVMSMDEAHTTKLSFTMGRLIVSSAANDIGEAKDEVPIKYAGEDIDIMFNPSYVMDPLKAIDDDEIYFNIINGHSPAVINCSIPFIYVIMPLRIN